MTLKTQKMDLNYTYYNLKVGKKMLYFICYFYSIVTIIFVTCSVLDVVINY